MIRDLQYPEDARKELNSLCGGLAYDAALAVAGVALSKIPLPHATPDFTIPVRCGGLEQDQAVRREARTSQIKWVPHSHPAPSVELRRPAIHEPYRQRSR
jgi:hypothetical protein